MRDMSNRDKIIKEMHKMTGRYGIYDIFSDFVKCLALSFSNQVQFSQSFENDYIETMKKYTKEEQLRFYEMTAWLVEWADSEMTDMLGDIYMHLEVSSKKLGQFFTPYHLCQLMAKTTDFKDEITTVNEPTCGAGGNIIAAAECMKEKGINYQKKMRAFCQDIDLKAVYMTYVQLTLYGIPAVVYQTNTLADPNGIESITGKMYTFGWAMKDM